jgi:DNA-binding winged helix-turn-helix (wHTH) protein
MAAIRLGGSVEAWPTQHRLNVDGKPVHVEPKVMAVCLMLLERPGDVVTRAELMDSVWAGRVVGEEVLTRCISELRSALGDKASNPQFIETVPKQGYRLLVVPEIESSSAPRRHLLRAIAAAAVAVITIAATISGWMSSLPTEPTRIAVLPFLASEADSHFGAGVAEELMNTLVGLPGLRVTSRTSAFAENPGSDPKVIGEHLDVDTLLTGTLRRDADEVRLSARLVDVASGDHLWADTFAGPVSTLYAMQDQVIEAVTGTLGISLDQPLKVARTTTDINARDLYSFDRDHWPEQTPAGLGTGGCLFRAGHGCRSADFRSGNLASPQ